MRAVHAVHSPTSNASHSTYPSRSLPVAADAPYLPSHPDNLYPAGPDTSGNIFYVPFKKPGPVLALILSLSFFVVLLFIAAYTYPVMRPRIARLFSKAVAEPPPPARRVIVPLMRPSSRYLLERAERKAKSLDLRPPTLILSYMPTSVSEKLLAQGAKPLSKVKPGSTALFSLPFGESWTSIATSETMSTTSPISPVLQSIPLDSLGTAARRSPAVRESTLSAADFLSVPPWKIGRGPRPDDEEAQYYDSRRTM